MVKPFSKSTSKSSVKQISDFAEMVSTSFSWHTMDIFYGQNLTEGLTTLSSTGSTPEEERPRRLSSGVAVVITVVVVIFTVPLIVANGMVIVAFLNDAQLRMTRNYYIFNLAVADFITGIFVIPFYTTTIWTWTWTLGRHLCTIWNIIDDTTLTVSHFSILLISYDRYLLVSDALKYNANEIPRRAIIRISITWITVTVIKIVQIVVAEWYYFGSGETESPCSPLAKVDIPYTINLQTYDLVMTTFTLIVEVLVPLVFIMAFNLRVYNTIHKRTRKGSAVNNLIRRSLPPCHMIANVEIANADKESERPTEEQTNTKEASASEETNDGCTRQRRHCRDESSITYKPKVRDSKPSIQSQFPLLDTIDEQDGRSSSSKDVENALLRGESSAGTAHPGDSLINIKHPSLGVNENDQKSHNECRKEKNDTISDKPNLENYANYHTSSSDVKAESNINRSGRESPMLSEAYDHADTWSLTLSSMNSSLSTLNMDTFLFKSTENTPVHNSSAIRPSLTGDNRRLSDNLQGKSQPKKEGRLSIKSVRFSTPEVQNPVHVKDTVTRGLSRQTSIPVIPRRRARSSTISLPKYKEKQDRKAAITLSLLVVLFVVFKLPMAIIMLVLAACYRCMNGVVFLTFTWIFRAKALLNPFLYAFISKRFRLYYLHLLRKLFCKENRVGFDPRDFSLTKRQVNKST